MAIVNTIAARIESFTDGFRRGIDQANTATEKFERSLGKGAQQLESFGDRAARMQKRIDPGAINRAEGAIARFSQTVQKGQTPLSSFIERNRTLGDVTQNLTGFVAGLNPVVAATVAVAGLAARAIGQLVDQQTRLGEETLVLSERLGISVEGISGLRVAASLSNVDIGALQVALRTLQRNVGAAASGSEEAQKKFKALGVEIRDATGAIKPVEQLMGEIGDSLAQTGDASLKAARGVGVYGRSFALAAPLVGLSAQSQRALTREAEIFGGVISTQFARASDEYRDNLERIRLVNEGVGRQIAEQLLPLVNGVAVQFLKLTLSLKILALQTFGVKNGLKTLEAEIRNNGDATGELTARLERMRAEATRDEARLDQLFGALNDLDKGFGTARTEARGLGGDLGELEGDVDKLAKAVGTLADEFELQFARLAGEPEPVGRALFEAGKKFAELGLKGSKALDLLVSKIEGLNRIGEFAGKLDSTVAAVKRLQASLQQLPAAEIAEALRLGPREERGEPTVPLRPGEVGPEAPRRLQPIAPSLPPEVAAGGLQEIPLQVELTAAEIEGLGTTFTTMFDVATLEAEEFFQQTADLGQQTFAALDGFAGGFADALVSGADIAKIKFGEFFKQLLKDLLKAIIRALILKAILGIFGGGLGAVSKFLKGALGGAAGTGGFPQRDEAALAGRAQIARGGATLDPALATAPANLAPQLNVRVFEPGPLTRIEFTDRFVIPRLRQRLRTLGEEPFTR